MTTSLIRLAQAEIASGRGIAAFELLRDAPGLAGDAAALQLFATLGLRMGRPAVVQQRLQQLIATQPDNAVLLGVCAAVMHEAGDARSALTLAARAVGIDPAQRIAAPIVVEALGDSLQISEAIRVSEACLQRDPGAWGVRLARLFAWMSAGESARAHADAEIVQRTVPHSAPARMNSALAALYLDEPASATLAHHASVAAQFGGLPGKSMRSRPVYRPGLRPLRVGIVSADLRRHPVGQLMAPLLRHLDRNRVEAVIYSDSVPDAHTAVLRRLVPAWHECRTLADAAVFDLVQRDAVDVLIDLGGYTAGARPNLFATRCAPAQLGYLGYLHATGLAAMDGLIGDGHTPGPAPAEGFERPLRLPVHLLCYEPPADAPPVSARMPGAIRFGSFNHLAKLSPATVTLWARTLQACPESTLALCALGLADDGVCTKIQRQFAAAGLDPSRLRLLRPEFDPARFLGLYEAIDIALDPLPFNGGMTGLQALWQGVPVLTLPGERMAARMGASMMAAVGLDRFIARDADEFVAIAARHAADVESLAPLRAQLRDRMSASGLVDGARFAEAFMGLLESSVLEHLSDRR